MANYTEKKPLIFIDSYSAPDASNYNYNSGVTSHALFLPVGVGGSYNIYWLLFLILLLSCYFMLSNYPKYITSFIYKLKNFYSLFKTAFFVCMLLSLAAFFLPSFQFYFMLLFSLGIAFFTLPYVDSLLPFRNDALLLFLKLLRSLNILTYFYKLFFTFFDKPQKSFTKQCVILFSFCLLYIFTSKYLFLHRLELSTFNNLHLFCLYLMLFLGFFATYTRFLLSTSILLVTLSENILFFGDLHDSDKDLSSNKPIVQDNSHKTKGFTLFDLRRTYNYENASRNSAKFKYYGLGIAICTLCVGGYAAQQQKQQNLFAQEQNRIAQEQNRIAQEQNRIAQEQNQELRRQNDLEEVSQKIMTEEDYLKRYKR